MNDQPIYGNESIHHNLGRIDCWRTVTGVKGSMEKIPMKSNMNSKDGEGQQKRPKLQYDGECRH